MSGLVGRDLSDLCTGLSCQSVGERGVSSDFHDEFDGKEIDRSKWIPEYLPSWPENRNVCTPTYEMKDGILRLIIDKNSKNEFGDGMYISGFMSASRTGMHRYDPKRKALHNIKTEATQINQYGYYEMRAKMQTGGGVHCAWWLIGFEDNPDQSCEVDILRFWERMKTVSGRPYTAGRIPLSSITRSILGLPIRNWRRNFMSMGLTGRRKE